jgi:hypothetical protein
MPDRPNCHYELSQPPKDVREWFRCDNCGVPLQVPSGFAKMLYWLGIAVAVVLTLLGSEVVGRNFRGRESPVYLIEICIGVLFGVLARLLWKTRLSQPRLYDPYSALNLSDAAKQLRGRSYRHDS